METPLYFVVVIACFKSALPNPVELVPGLCHQAGGELEQIQFLLGHMSVQTTERYLGCKQRLRNAVNDHIGLEPGLH